GRDVGSPCTRLTSKRKVHEETARIRREEERVARGGALKDLSPQGGCTALHSPTKLAMAISARIAMFGANESPSRAATPRHATPDGVSSDGGGRPMHCTGSVRTVLVPPVAASAPGRLPPRCAHGARQNSWTKKKHSPSN
ncbi:unnamed protein product, partial [Prorocentrum cordatum]